MSYYMESFLSIIRREIERTMGKLHKLPRMGLVSAYDKKNHAVKVKFQPTGTESGWIPLTGQAVGNSWGIASAPNINDQVEVHFYGGEHMVARVMTRHWSTKNKPPQLEAGEHQFTDKNGSTIYFKQDGTLLIGGASTQQVGQFAQGQSGNISTGQATGETGQNQQQQQNNPPNAKQTITLKPDGTLNIDVPNNDFNLTVDKTQINITGSQNVTLKSNSQDVNIIGDSGKVVIAAKGGISLDAPVIWVEGIIVQADVEPSSSGTSQTSDASGQNLATASYNSIGGNTASGLG